MDDRTLVVLRTGRFPRMTAPRPRALAAFLLAVVATQAAYPARDAPSSTRSRASTSLPVRGRADAPRRGPPLLRRCGRRRGRHADRAPWPRGARRPHSQLHLPAVGPGGVPPRRAPAVGRRARRLVPSLGRGHRARDPPRGGGDRAGRRGGACLRRRPSRRRHLLLPALLRPDDGSVERDPLPGGRRVV